MTIEEFSEICKLYGLIDTKKGNETPNLKYGRLYERDRNTICSYWSSDCIYVHPKICVDLSKKSNIVSDTFIIVASNVDELKSAIEMYLLNEKQYVKELRIAAIEEL